jgi:endonuclease YncB( thermonuclease family)
MRLLLACLVFCAGLAGVELRRETGGGPAAWGVSSLTVPGAAARETRRWPGPFSVDIVAVLDGDTVEVRFRDGPCGRGPCPGQVMSVRLLDIDAPEAHRCGARGARSGGQSCAACDAEHRLGRQALAFTRDLVEGKGQPRPARVVAGRPDKYAGRIVAALEVLDAGRWRSVGAALIEAGLAVPYDGRAKQKPWCAGR